MPEAHSPSESFSVSRFLVLLSLSLLCLPRLHAQSHPKSADLLKQMTLEEKIAQLSQMPGFPIGEFMEQIGSKPEDAPPDIAGNHVDCIASRRPEHHLPVGRVTTHPLRGEECSGHLVSRRRGDLEHDVRTPGVTDTRPGLLEHLVGQVCAPAGTGFDDDLQTTLGEALDEFRNERHPAFSRLGFLDDADRELLGLGHCATSS